MSFAVTLPFVPAPVLGCLKWGENVAVGRAHYGAGAFHEDEDTEDLLPPPLFPIAAVGSMVTCVVVVTCVVSILNLLNLTSHDAGRLPISWRGG